MEIIAYAQVVDYLTINAIMLAVVTKVLGQAFFTICRFIVANTPFTSLTRVSYSVTSETEVVIVGLTRFTCIITTFFTVHSSEAFITVTSIFVSYTMSATWD